MTRKEVESALKDRIRKLPTEAAARLLGLLPIGVEVILARPWSASECEEYAYSLGMTVKYELIEGAW